MIKVYSAANLQEAYILLTLFRGANIDVHIFNEHAQAAVGEIPFTHAYPEIWVVNDADVHYAQEILTRYENQVSSDAVKKCRFCLEESPENFNVCWRCGSDFQ